MDDEIRFQPFLPENNQPTVAHFDFEETSALRSDTKKDILIQHTTALLADAHKFAQDLMGDSAQFLSNRFAVQVVESESYVAQGILLRLSRNRLQAAATAPEDRELQDLERSQLLHEIVHNLTDSENFPMMAEIIYMLEQGHADRIKEILSMLDAGKLPGQYVLGLQEIATWNGLSVDHLKELFVQEKIDTLRQVFAQRMRTYCEKEFASQTENE